MGVAKEGRPSDEGREWRSLALGLEGWGEGLVPDPGGCALGSGKDVGSHRCQREDRPG